MIDIQRLDFSDLHRFQSLKVFGGNFLAGFEVDFTGFLVDNIVCRIAPDDLFGSNQQLFQALVFKLARERRR